ncbi:uncharacterized protein LOC119946227 [Tachyglossus aculeatus]|uniref:uncharacterized protein LOC119946227 n=1 Tax=Tachyglossus aculeatus TaxID=9261 RepID=UPI0018F7C2C2|nr:uncharacterized protein LOC119946227 [Tachyglossus aculeatus]
MDQKTFRSCLLEPDIRPPTIHGTFRNWILGPSARKALSGPIRLRQSSSSTYHPYSRTVQHPQTVGELTNGIGFLQVGNSLDLAPSCCSHWPLRVEEGSFSRPVPCRECSTSMSHPLIQPGTHQQRNHDPQIDLPRFRNPSDSSSFSRQPFRSDDPLEGSSRRPVPCRKHSTSTFHPLIQPSTNQQMDLDPQRQTGSQVRNLLDLTPNDPPLDDPLEGLPYFQPPPPIHYKIWIPIHSGPPQPNPVGDLVAMLEAKLAPLRRYHLLESDDEEEEEEKDSPDSPETPDRGTNQFPCVIFTRVLLESPQSPQSPCAGSQGDSELFLLGQEGSLAENVPEPASFVTIETSL